MRFSLGKTVDAMPSYFGYETKIRLRALNWLSVGDVEGAASEVGLATTVKSKSVPGYDGPNGKWWKAMKKLLADLKAAGE